MNEDQTVDVRAVMAIKAGTEITKSYVSSMETTQTRQQKLLSGWYFKCKCLRCIDPLEALSFTSSVACLKCRFKIYSLDDCTLTFSPLQRRTDSMHGSA